MLRMLIHPSFERISRYADRDLDDEANKRVASHLAHCVRCRERLGEIRRIDGAAQALPAPGLPSDLLERILARSSAGEAVILPVEDPRQVARPSIQGGIAAAAVLLIACSLALLGVPNLEAESSELGFLPERPRPGEIVHVEYRATARLGNSDRLALRARIHSMNDGGSSPTHERLAELERTGERTFRGSFQLPDSFSYAVFAVEDLRGHTVDHHGETWEILAHGEDGRPLADALKKKIADSRMRNTALALETARELARLYPDRVDSWDYLFVLESSHLRRDQLDSLRVVHRARLGTLLQALSEADHVTPEEMAAVVFYAGRLDDTATVRSWRDRLIGEHALHPATVQQRVFMIDRAGYFSALERLWEEVGDASPQLPFSGFMSAHVAKDVDMLRRWGRRYLEMDPGKRAAVARAYMEFPELQDEGIRLVREHLHFLASPSDRVRPLTETVDDQRVRLQRTTGLFLSMLGNALVVRGDTEAGVDALSRAIKVTWDVDVFRTVAEARIAIGDTAGALPILARVAADPSTSQSFADSAQQRVGRSFDPERWQHLVSRSAAEMRAWIFAQATNRPVRGKIQVSDTSGGRRSLGPSSEGGTLVAFWSRYCPPSLMQLEQLQATAHELGGRGVRVITITDEAPSSELNAFLERKGLLFPVFHDLSGEARRALDSFGTPNYIVLDSDGRIRFESRGLEDVVRQFAVLASNAHSWGAGEHLRTVNSHQWAPEATRP